MASPTRVLISRLSRCHGNSDWGVSSRDCSSDWPIMTSLTRVFLSGFSACFGERLSEHSFETDSGKKGWRHEPSYGRGGSGGQCNGCSHHVEKQQLWVWRGVLRKSRPHWQKWAGGRDAIQNCSPLPCTLLPRWSGCYQVALPNHNCCFSTMGSREVNREALGSVGKSRGWGPRGPGVFREPLEEKQSCMNFYGALVEYRIAPSPCPLLPTWPGFS